MAVVVYVAFLDAWGQGIGRDMEWFAGGCVRLEMKQEGEGGVIGKKLVWQEGLRVHSRDLLSVLDMLELDVEMVC